MKVLILHLSDAHLRHETDDLLSRPVQIATALGSIDAVFDACIVAVTGDIAYSGQESEFGLATQFFEALREALTARYPDIELKFVFVPGNHDCDFSLDRIPRPACLEAVRKELSGTKLEDVKLKALFEVQAAFFKFASKWMPLEPDKPWIYHEEMLCLTGARVLVGCYNTAYSSQLPEQQGKLFFPTHLVPARTTASDDASMTVALAHHPYNWLESANGLAFRAHLDKTADLVLTGHQHIESSYSKRDLRGDEVTYFEAAALQDSDGSDTGFNVLLSDVKNRQIQRFQFTWRGETYELEQGLTRPIAFPTKRTRRRFELSPEQRRFLADPGTGFTHPRVQELQLQDIFVLPDIAKLSIGKSVAGRDTPEIVRSRDGLEFLLGKDRLFLTGGDQAGKTTLAKVLVTELWEAGFVPIYVPGEELRSVKEQGTIKLINQLFTRQYSEESLEPYKRLEAEKKVLIVDGWHRANLNAQGKVILIELFAKLFGRIIILSGESFRIEEIGRQAEASNPLRSFQFCEIREFGHFLRGQLIEKWLTIGRDYSWDVNEHTHEIHETEKLLATLLGKNLIPSYPVNILAILQAIEARRSSTPSGSYGYLYEALLTLALSRVTSDSTELDLMYTFISRLAYFLFKAERKMLSRSDVEAVAREYFEEYSINIGVSDYLQKLESAYILLKVEGNYSFRYKYIYYYFVARHFQEGLRSVAIAATLKKKLFEMADQVYFEDYSGILMFVLYLTKDTELIRHIVANADAIYREQDPFDFEHHVSFINRLYKEAPKVLISSADVERNREEYRKTLDEDREADNFLQLRTEKFAYSDSLPDVVKFNIAFKTLQLLGQVLRNFPGSLHKDIKVDITRSCYSLGLRVMRAVMKIAQDNLEELRLYVAEIIRDHRPTLSDSELTKTADEAVIWLARRAAFGLIKRVSYSVGLELLNETYKRVLESSNGNMSVRVIDLSVKLDHFRSFPEDDINELWYDSRKNDFCKTVIRDMVAQFIYLFGLDDYQKLQSIGQNLDIKVADPTFRNPRTKKLKR